MKKLFLTKFAIIAVMIGFFSPSIQVQEDQKSFKISILQKAEANVNRYYGGSNYGYSQGREVVVYTQGVVLGNGVPGGANPGSCGTAVSKGIIYKRCGSTYYRPYYEGGAVMYEVAPNPFR